MKIPTHTITLEVTTALSTGGMRVMAQQLRELDAACPSVQHGATYRSMADAFDNEAEAREAADIEATERWDQRHPYTDDDVGDVVAVAIAQRLRAAGAHAD